MTDPTRRTNRPPPRRGSAVLQTVVVMNVLLAVSFGVCEFGQFLYIRHCFQAAARDAARVASLPSGNSTNTLAAVTATLAQANVALNPSWFTAYDISPDGSSTTTVTDITSIPSGDRVQIKIATTYDQVPNAFRPLYQLFGKGIGPGKPMVGTCTVVKE